MIISFDTIKDKKSAAKSLPVTGGALSWRGNSIPSPELKPNLPAGRQVLF